MKKLIAGLGLTVLAVPSAQAWTMDDSRTVRANQSQPIVRVVKRYQTATLSCEQCQSQQKQVQRHSPQAQATGWQRSARVTPQRMQRPRQVAARVPVRPVQMHAYYVPQRPAAQQPLRVHRIVGQAQPRCRYIG
ncbi:MAG: hypothetical protein BWK73_12075 [Thiothrix lacustris]|uniref:Uncharacterized protein n=1 Tax=Thiothrix lacustris TaxID=525917 RepID=A0A1Y1QTL0_9GAMM|nr:MAG: hypothetical protein BWK73_12075 [Thiothrix lacustris]